MAGLFLFSQLMEALNKASPFLSVPRTFSQDNFLNFRLLCATGDASSILTA